MKGREEEIAGPRMPWRYVFYLLVIGYLLFDLFLVRGPLWRALDGGRESGLPSREEAVERGWVAIAGREAIGRDELEAAVVARAWSSGLDGVPEDGAARLQLQLAALDELIDRKLLAQQMQLEPPERRPSAEQVDAAVARETARYPTVEALEQALLRQGMTAGDLWAAQQRRLTELAWLEEKIGRRVAVLESEARRLYVEDEGVGQLPLRFRMRHVFLARRDGVGTERGDELASLRDKLVSGALDWQLVQEWSEDLRAAAAGGELGVVAVDELPEGLGEAVAGLAEGELSEVLESELGWHLIELRERLEEGRASYAEMRDEIYARLESERRRLAVERLMLELRGRFRVVILGENLR
jgi:parvulin-like peptidyl-prolyl isomerase